MIRRLTQWIIFFSAVALFFGAFHYVKNGIEAYANRPPAPMKEASVQHPDVSVVSVTHQSVNAVVEAYGAAAPHFELTLTSQVSGQVEKLAAGFEPGLRIKKGDILATLEQSDYKAAVAAAEQDLSDARLALLEEERKALQAKAEWDASGISGTPSSPLVLRKPQLAAAKAAVAKAKANLTTARKNLGYTRITAPFDALVVERHIAPGSFLQIGTTVAVLYSTDTVEIAVSLSADAWQSLPEADVLTSGQWPVTLTHVQTKQQWRGRVIRSEQHLDDTSRQRRLILAVEHPFDADPALLPGTFVKADVTGRRLDNIWKLPGSAFSQKGEIWYIAKDNTLATFSATPLFSDAESVYISPPEALVSQSQQIVVHPLSSYLKGMVVNPVEES